MYLRQLLVQTSGALLLAWHGKMRDVWTVSQTVLPRTKDAGCANTNLLGELSSLLVM